MGFFMAIRKTSLESYKTIKENGLLSQRRFETYELLFKHGPATAMELRKYFPKNSVDSQIRARLNELREHGVAYERRERVCNVTGMNVIEWEVTDRLPLKLEKKEKIKCKSCKGKGYIVEQQIKLL